MNNSDFLFKSKCLLHDIAKQRTWLLKQHKGHLPLSYAETEVNNLNYAISKITDAYQMKSYLERKKQRLTILISSNNQSYISKLNQLIQTEISN